MIIYALDDEKAALYYLEESLREAFPDAEVQTFDRPKKLIAAFQEKPADVVVSDIEMPGMSGIDLAKSLLEIKEKLNIIFVTGYSEYAMDAFDVYASGYIMKPCEVESLKVAFSKLRYPLDEKKDIVIKTFGNFDVFFKGNPVKFRSPKSKELLAYLVDREGGLVSRMEIAGILYDDDYSRTIQQTLSRNARWLLEDLKTAGIEGLFVNDDGYYVDLSICDCDAIQFLQGNFNIDYADEYMEQYSWAEYSKGRFSKK